MNEKISILHEAAGAGCSIENFEFIVRSAMRYLQTKHKVDSL